MYIPKHKRDDYQPESLEKQKYIVEREYSSLYKGYLIINGVMAISLIFFAVTVLQSIEPTTYDTSSTLGLTFSVLGAVGAAMIQLAMTVSIFVSITRLVALVLMWQKSCSGMVLFIATIIVSGGVGFFMSIIAIGIIEIINLLALIGVTRESNRYEA